MINLFKIEADQTEFGNLIRQVVKEELSDLKNSYNHTQTETVLTRQEAADLLKVSLVTIHDWCNKGIIRHYKLGNRTYFKHEELMQSLDRSNTDAR